MDNKLNDVRNRFIAKSHDDKVKELMRQNLKGLTAEELNARLISTLPIAADDDYSLRGLYEFANMIVKSQYWPMILRELRIGQMELSVMKAENYQITTYGRATVNGFFLLDDLLKAYDKKRSSMIEGSQPGKPMTDEQKFQIKTPSGKYE